MQGREQIWKDHLQRKLADLQGDSVEVVRRYAYLLDQERFVMKWLIACQYDKHKVVSLFFCSAFHLCYEGV